MTLASDGQEDHELVSVDDVDDLVLKAAEKTLEWFTSDGPIDWERFIDRLEEYLPDNYEILDYDSPAVRKIQRYVRKIRNDS